MQGQLHLRKKLSNKRFDSHKICLTPISDAHATAVFDQARHYEIARLGRVGPFQTVDAARQWIRDSIRQANNRCFGIELEGVGLVGTVTVRVYGSSFAIQFWVGADYWGRGIGTRAGRLGVDWAFQDSWLQDGFTCAYADNPRSIRVLMNIGFERITPPDGWSKQKILYYHLGDKVIDSSEKTRRLGMWYSSKSLDEPEQERR